LAWGRARFPPAANGACECANPACAWGAPGEKTSLRQINALGLGNEHASKQEGNDRQPTASKSLRQPRAGLLDHKHQPVAGEAAKLPERRGELPPAHRQGLSAKGRMNETTECPRHRADGARGATEAVCFFAPAADLQTSRRGRSRWISSSFFLPGAQCRLTADLLRLVADATNPAKSAARPSSGVFIGGWENGLLWHDPTWASPGPTMFDLPACPK